MIGIRQVFAGLALALVGGGSFASGGTPYQIAYSGRLVDQAGVPVTGPVELSLKFFDAATAGNQLGTAIDDPGVTLADGVFSAPLTVDGATAQAVFGGAAQVWVEVQDVTHGVTYPRQAFSAVPYALRIPVDGNSVKFGNDGLLTVPPPAPAPVANGSQPGYIAASDWVQFNNAPSKTYVDNSLSVTNNNLATTNNNVTTLNNAALKKDGSVALTGGLNAGGQDISNVGNLSMLGSKVFGLSVATSDPANLTAGDTGKIWYNGGIRLWNGSSAQSLGIAGGGIQSMNGLNGAAQSLATGTAGTAPAWVPAGSTHTLNLPNAGTGGVTAGLISNGEWTLFNGKQNVLPAANGVTNGYLSGGDWSAFNAKQPLLPPGSLTANGYLASADWAAFNAKQPAGNYEPSVTAGTTAQFYRGDKSWQAVASGAVTESTNLYYTTARATGDARAAVSASAPLSYAGATGVLSLPPATLAANGYLASADWAAFNAKDPFVSAGSTAQYYRGDKSWQTLNTGNVAESGNLYFTIPRAQAAVTATSPLAYAAASGTFSLPPATGAAHGYLASADWLVFNGKQPNLGYAPVNRAGDTMTGSLNLPANGLAVGTTQLVVSGGSVGIGVASPGAALDVNGQVKIEGGTPGLYKVLQSDAAGVGTWQTPPHYGQSCATGYYLQGFTATGALICTPITTADLAFTQLASGGYSNLCGILTDQTAVCWGYGGSGQIGNGTTTSPAAPTPVMFQNGAKFTNTTSITAGLNFSCATRTDGSVWCWGVGTYGDIGSTTSSNFPVQVPSITTAVSVYAGWNHACALLANGTVNCWGRNDQGQLGNNTTSAGNTPTPVAVTGLTGVTALSVGGLDTCAIGTVAGATGLYCWGYNPYGELGGGVTTTTASVPTRVTHTGLTSPIAVSVGGTYNAGNAYGTVCAINSDNTVWCWGYGANGSLGNNAAGNSNVPVHVVLADHVTPLPNVASVASMGLNVCAVKTDGTAWCWGYNGNNELNTGSGTNIPYATQVRGLGGVGTQAGAKQWGMNMNVTSSTALLLTDGTVVTCGYGGNGELGNAATANSSVSVGVELFPGAD